MISIDALQQARRVARPRRTCRRTATSRASARASACRDRSALDQRQRLAAGRLVAEGDRAPVAAPAAGEARLGDASRRDGRGGGDRRSGRGSCRSSGRGAGRRRRGRRIRAIVPSSFMISQITPDGLSPASRDDVDRRLGMAGADQHAAVAGDQREDMAGRDDVVARPSLRRSRPRSVRARSAAEMPVVTPSRASIETVKAVSWRVPLSRLIRSRPSWSTRSLVIARQIRPRPCVAMKLIASGVAICAGMTRSPSFSRSSSSTRMNMRPLRASSMISSGEERKPWRRRASSGLLAWRSSSMRPR